MNIAMRKSQHAALTQAQFALDTPRTPARAKTRTRLALVDTPVAYDDDEGAEGTPDTASGGRATPFVKWAGGKRAIIGELTTRLPSAFKQYYEPFAGGGALYFALNGRITKALLSDTNFDLVVLYNAIKKDPLALLAQLEQHAKQHSSAYYYSVRSQHDLKDPIAIAARFLYLNRTCYNGLYRVNRNGEFNVPIGRYENPDILRRDNILACSERLQKARIEYREFDTIQPQPGDFVYFDPPYHPTSDTSFTSYTKLDFSEHDQVRLRDFALQLHRQGVLVMLSNSDTAFIRSIYADHAFHLARVQAPRNVNCKPTQRNSVTELLITNYEPVQQTQSVQQPQRDVTVLA